MKKPRTCYKIKNWRAYNESLVNRGSLLLIITHFKSSATAAITTHKKAGITLL
ncbi:hypothetical protein [Methylobacter sp.]